MTYRTWLSKELDERRIVHKRPDTEGKRPNKELEMTEGPIEVSKAGHDSDHHDGFYQRAMAEQGHDDSLAFKLNNSNQSMVKILTQQLRLLFLGVEFPPNKSGYTADLLSTPVS